MSIAFIVGNGFNYIIGDIINRPAGALETPEQLHERRATAMSIREITALWQKFDAVFLELSNQFQERGIRINHEEMIRMIYAVINLFSSISGFEQVIPPSDIEKLRSVFDGFLLDKIREIAKEFKDHEDSDAYSRIRSYFPTVPATVTEFIQSRQLGKVRVFTTNYDGIFDTIFTNWPMGGFIFSDGFIKSNSYPDLLELEPAYVASNTLVAAHLHGSYRFTKRFGRTYKTRANYDNSEPVMVFNNPNMKEEIVRADNVLSAYYQHLALILKKYDKLVILGNSMEAEPHIKKLINKYFNREGTSITVCSRNPSTIKNEVLPFYNRGEIHELSTNGISTEQDLIDLFDHLLR
ncbi:hypothetical protein [Hymenobacter rigui]|uniref:SIR2-like domain-containing protein n=1 Tax=Hymenobacter rigui TaxID=334424 RepID=A0A3R9P6E8_9BACT|nr:hypothetical protein [Hymenobacter rigui]RSK45206.1 hypothetical protein EI291_19025 [Hymenobacter rigui]